MEGRSFWSTSIKQQFSFDFCWFYLLETPWTRWRMYTRRPHRWVTPAASSPKYQRPSATWRSCAQKSTKTRYERSRTAGEGERQWQWQCDVFVNRLGYQRWKESKVPETDDTALTTIIGLLRAERGTDEGWEGLIFNHRENRLRTVFGPLFQPWGQSHRRHQSGTPHASSPR